MPKPLPPSRLLGKKIREARILFGLTQEELAQGIGAKGNNGAWISRIESGQCNPLMSTMRRIAKALGISVSDLLK